MLRKKSSIYLKTEQIHRHKRAFFLATDTMFLTIATRVGGSIPYLPRR